MEHDERIPRSGLVDVDPESGHRYFAAGRRGRIG
jgi:hypothetical protein